MPDSDKEGLNERKALALMLAQPSMIKRPVLDLGGKLLVGFKPDIYPKEVKPKFLFASHSPGRGEIRGLKFETALARLLTMSFDIVDLAESSASPAQSGRARDGRGRGR